MGSHNIKLFAKNVKSGNPNRGGENIQSGYRDGIWHRKMCLAYNDRLKKTKNGRNSSTKLRKNQNVWRKGNLQVLRNIGN